MGATWVFHRGALGDSVLLWPVLRGLKGRGEVVLVSEGSKAALAARELGIVGVDAEQRRFNALWVAGEAHEPIGGVARVIALLGEPSEMGVWRVGAARMFPGATIEVIGGRVTREEPRGFERALPSARENADGPMVLHVGAGSGAKRWPMARWAELADRLRTPVGMRREVRVIAGEVERERLDRAERALLVAMGGVYLQTLEELAEVVRGARVFVGNDSGPTHLAAALGVATVAVFGPTDPAVWGPMGPRVMVVRGGGGAWASVEEVEGCVERVLGEDRS